LNILFPINIQSNAQYSILNLLKHITTLNSFEVTGGKKLQGTIIPQGAKNEALQIISAVLLTPEKITIKNIPDILDVNLLIELLADMDVKIERPDRHTGIFQADNVNIDYLHSEAFRKKSGRLRGLRYVGRSLTGQVSKSIYSKTRRR
jgi:UDP-N-acetylglucosamine 1-carboxyvinyltransferase